MYVCMYIGIWHMYVCINIVIWHMYACMYIVICHMHVCMYIVIWHMHVCMYIVIWHMYVCMYIVIWHMYVCMYIVIWHIYVCMYIGIWHMYVCMCMYFDEVNVNILFVITAALNIFAPPGEVCSRDMATSSCSRDGDVLQWSYDTMRVIALTDRSDASMILMVDGITFTVTLIFLNTTLTISNISFTATPAADGKNLSCIGGTLASTATIHVVTDGKPLRYAVTCTCLDKTS